MPSISSSKKRSSAVIDSTEQNHRKQRAKVDREEAVLPEESLDAKDITRDSEATPEDQESRVDGVTHLDEPTADDPLNLRNSGLSVDFITRIIGMREYEDADRGVYYVTHVPRDLHFGKEFMFDMSNFLVRSDNQPIIIWIIGRIVTAVFQHDDGEWPDQPYITFSPLVREDLRAVTQICNEYAMPKQDLDLNPFGTVYAGRFQKRYKSEKPATQFRSVFDATTCMRKRKDMKPYDVTKLKRDDIVLAELRVKKRFEPQGADVEKNDRSYKITFQLDAINVLYVAPDRDADPASQFSF
ncbi:hypothetical protein CALCODRAFT_510149 [Calocera cornea HHB12733]|uniref:Uncharacterized protein n=1 Tax=Calocera cornea HHB12733 TaxID=1353952 RepID=A0A165ESJ0_9BASI|nr:hypothetical protein CALCODRAFT_510149 [Calocera cornea HHB12733]